MRVGFAPNVARFIAEDEPKQVPSEPIARPSWMPDAETGSPGTPASALRYFAAVQNRG
jgi:hypothetical protein